MLNKPIVITMVDYYSYYTMIAMHDSQLITQQLGVNAINNT